MVITTSKGMPMFWIPSWDKVFNFVQVLNSDSNETPRGKPNLQEVIDDRLETEEYKRPIGTQWASQSHLRKND